MLGQNKLTELLHEVTDIVKTSDGKMSREEILGYFDDLGLDKQQKGLILDYILKTQEMSVFSTEESKADNGNPDDEEMIDIDEEIDIVEEIDINEEMDIKEEIDIEDKLEIYNDPEIRDVMFLEEEEGYSMNVDVQKKDVKDGSKYPKTAVFQMYLDELDSLDIYEGQALEKLYQMLLGGDANVIPKISDSWMRRILEMAATLSVDEEDFGDVIGEGNMALFMALSDLCGSENKVDVDAVIEDAAIQAMRTYVQELTGEKDVRNAMLNKATLVNEAREYMAKENMQIPSVEELSDYTRIPEEELKDILEWIELAKK